MSYQNISSRQSGYGLVTFDDQSDAITNDIREQGTYGHIRFDDQYLGPNDDHQVINQQSQNPIQETQPIKKKRRRRRKPKFQSSGQGQYGLQNPYQFDPQYSKCIFNNSTYN